MRITTVMVLAGFVLGGCLQEVDPISSIDDTSSGIDNPGAVGAVTLSWYPPTQNQGRFTITRLGWLQHLHRHGVKCLRAEYTNRKSRLDDVRHREPERWYLLPRRNSYYLVWHRKRVFRRGYCEHRLTAVSISLVKKESRVSSASGQSESAGNSAR